MIRIHQRSLWSTAFIVAVALLFGAKNTLQAQCSVYFSSCPTGKNKIVDCDANGYESIFWPQPIAATTGGCINFTMTQISGPAPGQVVPLGTHTIQYKAQAVDNLTGITSVAYCTFQVAVIADTQAPVLTSCPDDITVYAGAGSGALVSWPSPTATDNCSVKIGLKTSRPCNSKFPIGTHLVLYKAVDPSGNFVNCSFTVTVLAGFGKNVVGNTSTTLKGESMAGEKLSTEASSPEGAASVTILPNPFQEELVLYTVSGFVGGARVEVLNQDGRLLVENQWPAETQHLVLNTSAFPPGVVFIKVVSSDGSYTSVFRGVKM